MDYEKKYNEALERARQIKDGKDEWRYSDLAEITPALTEIFPELRESEDFDEEVRKWLVGYFSSIKDTVWIHRNTITCEQILDWLEKQQEQKPAWSEEDEKMLADTIFKLAGFMGNEKNIDWLKSIRTCPSWKPSDHQMNILKAVKEYVGRGSGYWGEGLGSLIEDLEKLM